MAWPPAPLPTTRTNLTPQLNTHPAEHNAQNLAINDTVARVQFLEESIQRYGVLCNQTGRLITAGQVDDMTWSQRSTNAWGTGNTLTVPAGQGGVYGITAKLSGPASPAGGVNGLFIYVDGVEYANFMPNGQTQVALGLVLPLEAGDAVFVRAYNGTSTPLNSYFAATLAILRVGI